MADEEGVPYSAIKKALNHKTGDVKARYIISRVDSMRETFQKVADMVDWRWLKEPPGGIDDDEPDMESDDDMYS